VILLKIEELKTRLVRLNHPDALRIGVDFIDKNRLYIIVNEGIANINCDPIELYETEIKICVLEMITQGKLYLETNEKPLRIGQGRSIYCYAFKEDEHLHKSETNDRYFYFSSLFIRWQRTHELSDKQAHEMLGLTAKEFHLFREDELEITHALINKLTEVTGASERFWKNRWRQKTRSNKYQ
jgi:hypothetical protein